ncbi:hypothetical protein [Membranihabitans marinus]|uniref:hypothetical protein n=1 Tax=Membranihabitans marinus TaxID=1227546 RepID=UPI001F249D0E|nr:hypothetical protein [Membranihabitans marinus]
MKRIVNIIAFMVVVTAAIHAQEKRPDKFEEITAQRVAYITERISLTVKEAQVFWPVYNDYTAKMRELKNRNYIKEADLNDNNAREFLHNKLDNEKKIVELKSNFYDEISDLISYRRIYLLEKAEYEFRHKLLDRYKNKK